MAPHLVEQLVLRDHAVAVLDEVREDVEDLRLDVLRLVVSVQRVASVVDHRVAEHVPHRGIVVGVATGGILSGWPMVRLHLRLDRPGAGRVVRGSHRQARSAPSGEQMVADLLPALPSGCSISAVAMAG
jgi:hypothetical protein